MDNEQDETPPHATRKRRRRLRPETVEKLRILMDAGKTPGELATRYKLPYFTLYQIKRGWAYKNAPGPIQEEKIKGAYPSQAKMDKIKELHGKGVSMERLAEVAKLPASMIRRIVTGAA